MTNFWTDKYNFKKSQPLKPKADIALRIKLNHYQQDTSPTKSHAVSAAVLLNGKLLH